MVSCRPHNFFDTASYTKPLRFQIYLATFLSFSDLILILILKCFINRKDMEGGYTRI